MRSKGGGGGRRGREKGVGKEKRRDLGMIRDRLG